MASYQKGVRLQNGKWHYRIMVQGTVYRGECEGCTSKKSAQAWTKQQQDRLRATTSVDELDARRRADLAGVAKTPLDDSLELFYELPKDRAVGCAKTQQAYVTCWTDFCGYLKAQGVAHVAQITESHARNYIHHLRTKGKFNREVSFPLRNGKMSVPYSAPAKKSANSVNKYHTKCSYVMKVLLQNSGAPNPFAFKKMATKDDVQPRDVFPPEVIKAMLEQADDFCLQIVRMGLLTGKRRNEICMLEWADVVMSGDRQNWAIMPRKYDGTKRKNTGVVPIYGELLVYLQELIAKRDERLSDDTLEPEQRALIEKYVLPEHATQFQNNQTYLSLKFRRMVENLQGVTVATQKQLANRGQKSNLLGIHSLRHTFIFNLAKQGVPVDVAMGIVGHLSEAVHAQYRDHFTTADRLLILEQIHSPFAAAPAAPLTAIPMLEPVPEQPKDPNALAALLKELLADADPAAKMAILQQLMQ